MERDLVALAVKKAAKSEVGQRHGAVIVSQRNGFILGSGCNMAYDMPGTKFKWKFSQHAEMRALRAALKKYRLGTLSPWMLVVVRINPRGELRFSKPCDECTKILESFNIDYSFSENALVRDHDLPAVKLAR